MLNVNEMLMLLLLLSNTHDLCGKKGSPIWGCLCQASIIGMMLPNLPYSRLWQSQAPGAYESLWPAATRCPSPLQQVLAGACMQHQRVLLGFVGPKQVLDRHQAVHNLADLP